MVQYDEANKLYMVDNNKIYEYDTSINKNNEYRKLSDGTTLGNYDMGLLYQYAQLRFNNKDSYDIFLNKPLKEIFLIPQNKLCINNLMGMAYDYVFDKKEEPFEATNDVMENYNIFWILIIVLCIINMILLCYLCFWGV
jgi:hypothetical protein